MDLIIVPIHEKDFRRAQRLLDSAGNTENICLVFSDEQEASKFHHPFPYIKHISDAPLKHKNYITLKKLGALKEFYKSYEHIAIIDCESRIVKPVCGTLSKVWERGMLANHSIDGSRIANKIASKCGYDKTDDLYCWFNQIPVYKSSLVEKFFTWLDERANVLLDYEAFDFILFSLYCRYELNMEWKIISSVVAHHGLIENPELDWKNRETLEMTNWSTRFNGVEQFDNIQILFHLDRY